MNYGLSDDEIACIRSWLGSGSINLFGLPFSGKDTQGKRLSKIFDAPLIGGGDIIRGSDREDVKRVIADGSLAPKEDYLTMITPYLSREEFRDKPLVLSSVGRWHGEEQTIVQSAEQSQHPVKAVVLLDISSQHLRERHQAAKEQGDRGNREDDADEHIEKRIKEFETKTQPVIDYYSEAGLLIKVDGAQEPNTVTVQILQELLKKAI